MHTLSMAQAEVVYQAVVTRRLQWDNLLWQVPILSLTAQAFLFTIALGAGSSPVARTMAAVLSIIVTGLSVTLMARHRQAELADAAWLEEYEKRLTEDLRVHGFSFVRMRDSVPIAAKRRAYVPLIPGYMTWTIGLLLFAVAALLVIVFTWVPGAWLSGS
jgi:hypothetical protein